MADSESQIQNHPPPACQGHHVQELKDNPALHSESSGDPFLVTWNGAEDPENPKNWTYKRKWLAVTVLSCFALITPISSSIVAPGLTIITNELQIEANAVTQLVLSAFVIGFAFGPFLIGPLSEIYGRVPILQAANLFYLIFNIACGVSRNSTQLILFRILSGLGGSAPLAIGGGVIGDCFTAEQRARAVGIYSLTPLLGPAIGPIVGGFIIENTSWRWMFYATSIADGVIQAAGIFLLQETFAPSLLQTKARKLRQTTGNSAYHTEFDGEEVGSKLRVALVRPCRLLLTQPIVQVVALYSAYVYGVMYLMLSTFPDLWSGENRYHESISLGALNYISLALGFTLGSQLPARVNDRVYLALSKRPGQKGCPEFRVPPMVLGSVLVPIGLLIYGWSAQALTHWIVPNLGAMTFAIGSIMVFQGIQVYVVDAYTRYAASAMAAASLLRSLTGMGFPLFAPYMFEKLDYGWGNSLLAFISIAIGFPAPILLWYFGADLRKRSTFAAGA